MPFMSNPNSNYSNSNRINFQWCNQCDSVFVIIAYSRVPSAKTTHKLVTSLIKSGRSPDATHIFCLVNGHGLNCGLKQRLLTLDL